MHDTNLLTDFAHTFLGYGNLDAPTWFVGMEEGGGESREEIAGRLRSWNQADRSPVVDIVEFGRGAGLEGHLRWFEGERPPLQTTWKQLIRMVLSTGVEPLDNEAIRAYQRDIFARADGNECLLELLPLPSPNVGEWRYGEWFELPWLRDRETYRARMLEHRVTRLRALVDEHEPGAVVFYSRSYLDEWCRVAGVGEHQLDEEVVIAREDRPDLTVLSHANGTTTFVVTNHPSAFGVTNAYFDGVSRLVASPV